MIKMEVLMRWTIAAMVLLSTACGSSYSGGGGVASVGGPAGTVCYPDVHLQGCFANQVVRCDGDSSTWAVAQVCASGTVCVTKADANDPQGVKLLGSCVAQGSGGGADAGSSQSDGATSQDWFSCVQGKCSTQLATCNGSVACTQGVACYTACNGENKCSQACFDSTPKDDQPALIAVFMCAQQVGCPTGPAQGGGCGDGTCGPGETTQSCPADCKQTSDPCGNGVCDVGETPQSCPADCKQTSDPCGNGVCDVGETPQSCPADCKQTSDPCGNGVCDVGETPQSCPADCKQTSNPCGNGVCDVGETPQSCPQDCTQGGGGGADCVEQKCGTQLQSCMSDVNCVAVVYASLLLGCVDDNQCQDQSCVQSKCGQEYTACGGLQQCAAILSCLQTATSEAAAQACISAGAAKYQALGTCIQTNCPNG